MKILNKSDGDCVRYRDYFVGYGRILFSNVQCSSELLTAEIAASPGEHDVFEGTLTRVVGESFTCALLEVVDAAYAHVGDATLVVNLEGTATCFNTEKL